MLYKSCFKRCIQRTSALYFAFFVFLHTLWNFISRGHENSMVVKWSKDNIWGDANNNISCITKVYYSGKCVWNLCHSDIFCSSFLVACTKCIQWKKSKTTIIYTGNGLTLTGLSRKFLLIILKDFCVRSLRCTRIRRLSFFFLKINLFKGEKLSLVPFTVHIACAILKKCGIEWNPYSVTTRCEVNHQNLTITPAGHIEF